MSGRRSPVSTARKSRAPVELLVDAQHQALARLAQQKAVRPRDVHERRDVEALLGAEAHAAVSVELAGCSEQIRPALPERVVHLRHDARQRVVGVAHEIERDGIEDVPERARVREQLDASVGHVDTPRVEPRAHVVANREARIAEVIGSPHLHQVAAAGERNGMSADSSSSSSRSSRSW